MLKLALLVAYLFHSLTSIATSAGNDTKLQTLAEKSAWKQTGRYEEVLRLCKAFEKEFYNEARCLRFGTTPEGRPMVYLVAGHGRLALDPEKAKKSLRPVMVFQGGIHAGEIDGKDAGFWFLRQVLRKEILKGSLSKLTYVFVPVFNIDGHERFGKFNRPNQNGPEEMGWRVTGQNYNLNRDYAKADSPEMLAMHRLLNQWDPILYLDLHVTDGAKFQHDVAVMVAPTLKGPPSMTQIGLKASAGVMQNLEARGHLPLPFYPSFIKDDEPTSGFDVGVAPPRFSQSYWALHNRFGVLVETHSWKDYATRVRSTRDTLEAFAQILAEEGKVWVQAAMKLDEDSKQLGGTELELAYETTSKVSTIDFKGYKYKQEKSEVSGAIKITYFPDQPETWKVPFFGELESKLKVKVPQAGYLIPRPLVPLLLDRLKAHGVKFQEVNADCVQCNVETFRASEIKFAKETYEGHLNLTLKGEWKSDLRSFPSGSLFVPIAQPLSKLVVHLFEPTAPDSYLTWGFFNAFFEKKEYMESYVAEELALELLAKDAKLKKEFEERLKDPDFAKNPEERLEFFHRQHPSWDERYGLYPVYRMQTAIVAK